MSCEVTNGIEFYYALVATGTSMRSFKDIPFLKSRNNGRIDYLSAITQLNYRHLTARQVHLQTPKTKTCPGAW